MVLQSDREVYYKVNQVSKSVKDCYYKVRRVLKAFVFIHFAMS